MPAPVGLLDGLDCGLGLSATDVILINFQQKWFRIKIPHLLLLCFDLHSKFSFLIFDLVCLITMIVRPEETNNDTVLLVRVVLSLSGQIFASV